MSSSTTSISSIKKDLIFEINKIRTDPKSYIKYLEEYLKNFEGKNLKVPNKREIIETTEGPSAYIDAINFLKTQRKTRKLRYYDKAEKSAEEACLTLQNCNFENSISNSLEERKNKYLESYHFLSEIIDLGGSTAKDIVVNFIVDDGIKLRTNRDIIFNENFIFFGISIFTHKEYNYCTVIDFVGIDNENTSNNKYEDILKRLNNTYIKAPNNGILNNSFEINNNYLYNNNSYNPRLYNSTYNNYNLKTYNFRNPLLLNNDFNYKNDNINGGKIDLTMIEPNQIKTLQTVISPNKKKISEYTVPNYASSYKGNHTLINRCSYDEIINKYDPFFDDEEAPKGNIIKRKEKKIKKIIGNRTIISTVKVYFFDDGTEETVNVEEIEYD